MRKNEKPKWEPTPEEIARECELIRAEKLECENEARIVGNAKNVWYVPVIRTKHCPPPQLSEGYQ